MFAPQPSRTVETGALWPGSRLESKALQPETMKQIIATSLVLGLASLAAFGFAQDKSPIAKGKPAAIANAATDAVAQTPEVVIATQKPSYPLTTCPISGEAIAAGEGFDFAHEGRLVRTCCEKCVDGVKKDFAAVTAKIDAAVIAAQKPGYPAMACPISGEELGGMGEPIDYVYGTRLVRFCCKGCVKGFNKNPIDAMAKIDAALIEKQKASYPLTTCVVSGEDLVEGEAIDHLYGVTLVRFCCKGCLKELRKQPEALVAKVVDASHKTDSAK
jgi:hypothetical protein